MEIGSLDCRGPLAMVPTDAIGTDLPLSVDRWDGCYNQQQGYDHRQSWLFHQVHSKWLGPFPCNSTDKSFCSLLLNILIQLAPLSLDSSNIGRLFEHLDDVQWLASGFRRRWQDRY